MRCLPPFCRLVRRQVTVIILNLSPGEAIDYAAFTHEAIGTHAGEWLAWCQACPYRNRERFSTRAHPYFEVTGMLDGPAGVGRNRRVGDAPRWVGDGTPPRLMGHYTADAGHLLRPDAPGAGFAAYRDAGSDELAAHRPGRAAECPAACVVRVYSRSSRNCSERGWRARREPRWRSTPVRVTPSGRWRITIRDRQCGNETPSQHHVGTSPDGAGVPVAGEYEVKNAQGHEDHGRVRGGRIVFRIYAAISAAT